MKVDQSNKLCNLARLLALQCNESYTECDMCGGTYIDSVEHVIMQCSRLNAERDKLWDQITEVAGVHAAVCLFQKSEPEVLDIFLGKRWELVDVDCHKAQAFLCAVADGIKTMILNA